MDDVARFAVSTFVTAWIGAAILGIKQAIKDARIVHRCYCGCLRQDHDQQLAPGRTLAVIDGGCYRCPCKKYREVSSR